MALTDVKIRTAKAAEKVVKLSDGEGLQLWISPAGGKLWRLAYRFNGKQRKLAIGSYPDISLQEARERRREARRKLREGVDPAAHKQVMKALRLSAAGNTFGVIADELMEKKEREGRSTSTLKKNRWLLGFAFATLRDRPITEITAQELLVALRAVEARQRYESAARLRSVMGEVFRFAIATARASNDPTTALKGALVTRRPTHRAAILETSRLGALLRAIDGFDGHPQTRASLQLMALLFPRPGELRLAEWNEFDLDMKTWAIPASRMKMRRPYRMPLSNQAVNILRNLRTQYPKSSLVLPSVRSQTRAISDNTMNAALRRMGYRQDEMTAHGFRSSASTFLNESRRWSSDAVERQLAHVDQDDVRRAYARGEYWQERVEMMQWWADRLDEFRADKLSG